MLLYVVLSAILVLIIVLQVSRRNKMTRREAIIFLASAVVLLCTRWLERERYEGNLIFIWYALLMVDGVVWLAYTWQRKNP